ncbi:PAS domain S-box protein [Spirosoma rhododendri]|uniref:histidine kinase n=1 Tax=Spirosoma rhododendri TaxID=2728024 RepID=A0A7L5DPM4_9BACT|nr:PAS domain S-box protein [Spirosoma rhododendri]QJD80434.1 PAS domain S-box protein [Spirosoma rhododendri]
MNEEHKPFNQNVVINNEQTRLSLEAANIGTWSVEPLEGQIYWDELCQKLLHFGAGETVAYDQVLAHVHADDVGLIHDTSRRAFDSRKEASYNFTFRTVNPHSQEICWLSCNGRGYVDDEQRLYRISGILRDVTRDRRVKQVRTEAQTRFEAAFDNASLGFVITGIDGVIVLGNKAFGRMLGYTPEELVDMPYTGMIHPDDRARNEALIDEVVAGNVPFFDITKQYVRRDGSEMWVRMNMTPLTDEQGNIRNLLGIAQDITRDLEKRRENNRLGQLVRNAPEMMVYMDLNGHVQFMNPYGLDLLGLTAEDVIGKTVDFFSPPEEHDRIRTDILPNIRVGSWSGELMKWHRLSGERIPVTTNIYPINDPITGEPYGMVAISRDLRQERQVQREIEAKNRALELALEIGQLGTYQIDLQTNRIVASERARTWWGLPDGSSSLDELLGKVLPADQSKWSAVLTQARLKKLDGHHDLTYRIINRQTGEYRYLRSLGQAVYDNDEAVTLSGTVQDITPQILTQLKIEKSEIRLSSAVDLADLGMWQIDLATGMLTFSDRIRVWYGFSSDEPIPLERSYEPVDPADVQLLKEALDGAASSDKKKEYDVEYRIKSLTTGRKRIIHAKGHVYYDAFMEAYRVSGTMQDVTEQRQTELALEMEVQERIEQLAATNEEMAAINEEMMATNEELAATNEEFLETNRNLTRSNQNLEQFAYIASHDLQEPLRKIQQFGDLLKTRYANDSTEEYRYLERMQLAASRMSVLIKDLLAFSRISTQQVTATEISLTQVISVVQDNLTVSIEESDAQIDADNLPMVQGDVTQLEQLFQNLLSNAIKFSRVDLHGDPVIPHIRVTARLVTLDELPASIKPGRQIKTYYRIDVVDNGVGFEEKYTNRIFQVFQRLHGNNEFAGTGIGLAICQKVVTNHGGIITATSQPGQGATFSVYLPK